MPPGEAARPPGTIGRYRVLGELGRGGMGVVYLGLDARLQREVALKLLPADLERDPEARDRLFAEARTLASLNHPNIATIHSLEEHAGGHFLTMERIEGRSLWERLQQGPLPLDDALAVGRQVARALEAAHAKGVVHRDLKPSNVMLRDDGTAKVFDFGLALRVEALLGTSGAEVAGTPGYMSPEQVRGEPADVRSDVWAMGALMHECVTGRELVPGASAYEKLAATLALDVAALVRPAADGTGLPPRLTRFLARCLAEPASERFASMREARLLLEEEIAERALPRGVTPAPVAASRPPGNLPRRLTRFVGRMRETEAASRLVREHRLVTVTGAGGCGKSRFAIELAARLVDTAPDGVWFVELASLSDPSRLVDTIASALPLPSGAGADARSSLGQFVADKRLLLVLDNCEHLVDGCAELVTHLLASGEQVRVLATSREALRMDGEAVFALPPLGLPAGGPRTGPRSTPTPSGLRSEVVGEVEDSDAVLLFADRARAVLPGFALDAANRAIVAEICQRLDGIPLAIELAAARVKVLALPKILSLLDDRFRLLTTGTRTAQAHQQTLRTLIDWSHDRLEPGEQAVLRRLAVFRGAWTLEGAEAVAPGGDVASWDVLDLFTRLVEKSLVSRDLDEAGVTSARYSLLESIREYAHEKLLEHPEEAAEAARRHRDYILSLAAEGFDGLKSAAQAEWTVRLDHAMNDVRAVLTTLASDPGGAQAELNLNVWYGLHWFKRGMWSEGRERLQHALARPDADRTSAPYGQALNALGNIHYRMGDLDTARAHYLTAIEVLSSAGTPLQLANTTINVGNIAWLKGELDDAERWYERSLEHYMAAGSKIGAAGCLNNMSVLAVSREQFDRVEAIQTEVLAIFEEEGLTDNVCLSLFQLGAAALVRNDFELARERFMRALRLAREADNRWNILAALDNLACVENHRARPEAAREPLAECLVRLRDMPDPVIATSTLENTACMVLAADPATAAALFAAADAERDRRQLQGMPHERRHVQGVVAALRGAMGEAAYERARAAGAGLSLDQALARAEALLGLSREA